MENRRIPLLGKLAAVLGLLVLLTPPAIELDFSLVIGRLAWLLVGYLLSNSLSGCAHPANMSAGLRGASPANPMRPRNLLLSLAAGIIVALIVLSLADSLLVDLLWFSTLGYRQVFNITISAEVVIFTIVWVVAFLAIWISGMIALRFSRERERLHVVGRSDEMVEVNLPEMIRTLGNRVPWKLLVLGGAAILALFVAQGEASSWDVYLKAPIWFHSERNSLSLENANSNRWP
jgi:Uncharacterised protein family (UPF0182)